MTHVLQTTVLLGLSAGTRRPKASIHNITLLPSHVDLIMWLPAVRPLRRTAFEIWHQHRIKRPGRSQTARTLAIQRHASHAACRDLQLMADTGALFARCAVRGLAFASVALDQELPAVSATRRCKTNRAQSEHEATKLCGGSRAVRVLWTSMRAPGRIVFASDSEPAAARSIAP